MRMETQICSTWMGKNLLASKAQFGNETHNLINDKIFKKKVNNKERL
jgi:hypothetical protein